MSRMPLVSVIIPTKNSSKFLEGCLKSIKNQTYKNIEIIVVDNNSTDQTRNIAKKFSKITYDISIPGKDTRNIQRVFGANKAKGSYLLFIDSDMELMPGIIAQGIEKFSQDKSTKALIIPERSIGNSFWAKCKSLEKSLYVGNINKEAARFYNKSVYGELGGYNPELVVGEDYEMSDKVFKAGFKIKRIDEFILHNEGRLKLKNTVRKKYYYGSNAREYLKNHPKEALLHFDPFLLLSFKNWGKLIRNPILSLGMLFMKTCEFVAGGLGYFISLIKR